MTISARQMLVAVVLVCLVTITATSYWPTLVRGRPLGDAIIIGIVVTLLMRGFIILWRRNPKVTIGSKDAIPKATATYSDEELRGDEQ